MRFSKTYSGVATLALLFGMVAVTGLPSRGVAQTTSGQDAVAAHRAELEQSLANIEAEIAAQNTILAEKQKESASLQRDVAILNAKISSAQLSIKARDITLANLTDGINAKERTIDQFSAKLDRERASLAQLLRKTDQLDTYSLSQMVLGGQTLSQFFADADAFSALNDSIHKSLGIVVDMKEQTEAEKAVLEDKKQEESSLRQAQVLQKQRLDQAQADKKQLLKATQGKEKEYQKIILAKQKSAASIRAELFSLQGSAAIPFGKAFDYANVVYKQTGVRPAFLLGIIAEESNLGENVGTGTWTVDMHPTRDRPVFLKITAALGLDPNAMPVSKKVWYGYGGAMGPAQFIPSTWALYGGYDPKNSYNYNQALDYIGKKTGNFPSNPWDPQDAFMASGLLLKDNGAAKGTYSAEFRAAMCYLAGCGNANKASLQFYGQDVMSLATKYQGLINTLQSGT